MATRTVMKRSFDDACSPRHYEAYVELNAEKKCRSVTSIVTIADALASEGPGSESDDGRRSPAPPAAVAASGAKFERLFNGGGARAMADDEAIESAERIRSTLARGLHRHFAAVVAAELVDGAVDGTCSGANDRDPKTGAPPRALHTELLRVVALLEHRDAPAKS